MRTQKKIKTSMEAFRSLENKLSLTTLEAALLLVCTAMAVIGLCTAKILKMKASTANRENNPVREKSSADQPGCGWASVKRALVGSVKWSGPRRWGEDRPPPSSLLVGLERSQRELSHGSASPVWQRPILMGEKCELPRFSGLILYDERGRLLDQALKENITYQENPASGVRTTLRDLL